jgi:drug/metabolite transporter (DMT)-like permease
MSYRILGIMLVSALCHATWNALAKHVESREALFTLAIGIGLVVYSPLAMNLAGTYAFPVAAAPWVLASALFEVLYFLCLARTYREADYTTVYPIIRGCAPTATLLLSVLLTGARVTSAGALGVLAIASGIFLVNETKHTLPHFIQNASAKMSGVKWAALTGLMSASANMCDKAGATLMTGALFKYAVFVFMLLGKYWTDRKIIPGVSHIAILKKYPVEAFAAGFLVYGANSLSIFAMESTPVAYVAALKELSIIFATVIGALFLKERVTWWKVGCIMLILSGVMMLRLG